MSLYSAARSAADRWTESRSSLENPATVVRDYIADQLGIGTNNRGVDVSPPSVAGYPPVAQALQLLSNDQAKIPLVIYKRDGEFKEPDRGHHVHNLVNLWGTPNENDTAFELWQQFLFDALLFGRGALWIEREGARPVGLHRLLPDRIEPKTFGGRKYYVYEVTRDDGRRVVEALPNVDVLFLRTPQISNLPIQHPVAFYRRSYFKALAAADFTAQFFNNGAHLGGILQTPPGASEQAIDTVEKAIRRKAQTDGWFKSMVLRDGFKWTKTTASPAEAQSVELDEAAARDVARIYNMPPSKLGVKGSTSYNSLEQERRDYIDSSLAPRFIAVQSQVHTKMLSVEDRRTHFAEYLIDAMQWADAETRARIAERGIRNGWLHPEEVRAWSNLRHRDDLPKPAPANAPTTDEATSA